MQYLIVLVRGTDPFSLKLSNKRMTTANIIAIQCAWIKIISIFCQIGKTVFSGVLQNLVISLCVHDMKKVEKYWYDTWTYYNLSIRLVIKGHYQLFAIMSIVAVNEGDQESWNPAFNLSSVVIGLAKSLFTFFHKVALVVLSCL